MGQFHLGFVTMKTCFAFILFASSINFIFAKDCSEGGVSECVDSHRGRFNDECSEYQAMIDCYQGCQLSSAAKFLQKGYKKFWIKQMIWVIVKLKLYLLIKRTQLNL